MGQAERRYSVCLVLFSQIEYNAELATGPDNSVFYQRNGASDKLFVDLRELASHGDLTVADDSADVFERRENPVWRFEEHHDAPEPCQAREPGLSVVWPSRRESQKTERIGREARGDDRGEDGAWTGNGLDANSSVDRGPNHPVARIGDGWRSGVGHERNARARLQLLDQARDPCRLVVRMQAHRSRGDAVVREELVGSSGILDRD